MIMEDIKITKADIDAGDKELLEKRDELGTLDHLGPDKVERMRKSRARKAARKRNKALRKKDFSAIMDEVIDLFVKGNFTEGAEGVAEIASLWKSSGNSIQDYLNLMTSIEDTAIEKSGAGEMLRFQIRDALRDYSAKKRGSIIIQ